MSRPVVLVVEDEGAIRMVAAEALQEAGFEVIEADDGLEALEVLMGLHRLDLLFTDVNMPGPIDGLALAAKAQALRPGLNIIITSAALGAAAPAALPEKAAFLPKPYALATLAEAATAALSARKSSAGEASDS